MTADERNEILEELHLITKLLIWRLFKDETDQKEKIEILNKFDLQPQQIAEYLGTTANTVSVTLNKIRRKQKPKKQEK